MSRKDILGSAALAKNNYCSFLDEKLNYIPYFYLFTDPGPFGAHCEWDFGDATGRYLDALLLCCEISGFDADSVTAAGRLKKALDGMVSPEDGLCYRPDGYDWVKYGANSFDQRSCLLGLATWYGHSGDRQTALRCENLVRGLYGMGREYGGYFYIPVESYDQSQDKRIFDPVPFDLRDYGADPCHYGGGVLIYPLMYWHRLSGSAEAFSLAGKLARFILYHSGVFAEDGSFWMKGSGVDADGHFHSRMDTVAGILEYAYQAGEEEMAARCRQIYDWAVTQGTSYGLFPEGLGKKVKTGHRDEYPDVSKHSEICCTTDMIEAALLLGRHADSGYFDHAENYLNHLLACQLDDISWMPPSSENEESETVTCRNAAERYRGAFTGRTLPNDLLNRGRYDTMGCCAAAGGRGLYMLWENAAVLRDGRLIIDLWLDSDNGIAKITHDADRGELTFVTGQKAGGVMVRIPSWLEDRRGAVRAERMAERGGDGLTPVFCGRYMLFPPAAGGERFRISYPVKEARETIIFCGEEYTVSRKGSKVTGVLPPGPGIPLYAGGE